ncbi:queuosine precursor transporter [Patescibacteria group bacterium]
MNFKELFSKPQEKKALFLLGIFILALTTANLLGSKITTILGVSVSVGIFTYPFTFVVTDVIEDVFGKKVSRQFLLIGVIALALLFALTALSVVLPAADRFADQAAAYNSTFKNSLRFIFASLVAFTISQSHDIWAFSFWKKKTKGRWLWLRNNLSTVVSQGIDTFIFMFIAFYQLTDKFTAGYVVELALTYWAFKVVFAIIDTPLVYAGVRWMKGKSSKSSG